MKLLKTALLALMSMSSLAFADAGTSAQAQQGSIWQTVIMIGIVFVFFYFILWRPEQKRRKALEKQRSSLQKGCKVTAMGIIGTVLKVEEKTVILKMYDGAKIEVLKAAVTDVQPGTEVEEKKTDL